MRSPSRLLVGTVLVLLSLVPAGPAGAVSVSYSIGGTGPMHFPGPIQPPENAPWGPDGYPGDTIELQPFEGTLELEPGIDTLKINTLHWIVDYTYGGTETDPDDWHDLEFEVPGDRSITLDAEGGVLHQTGLLSATWFTDSLSLHDGSTALFVVQGYTVEVTPLALPVAEAVFPPGGNPWLQPDRDVYARFEVAEVSAVGEPVTGRAAAAAPLHILSLAPNPFRQAVRVSYEARVPGPVYLEIYDAGGRLLSTASLGYRMPGSHVADWSPGTLSGWNRGAGVYFLRLGGAGVKSEAAKAYLLR